LLDFGYSSLGFRIAAALAAGFAGRKVRLWLFAGKAAPEVPVSAANQHTKMWRIGMMFA
jgi:hypothetical protein